MDEQEPNEHLSSPIIGPDEQYRKRPEQLDRALFVGAAAVLIAIIVILVVWQPWS